MSSVSIILKRKREFGTLKNAMQLFNEMSELCVHCPSSLIVTNRVFSFCKCTMYIDEINFHALYLHAKQICALSISLYSNLKLPNSDLSNSKWWPSYLVTLHLITLHFYAAFHSKRPSFIRAISSIFWLRILTFPPSTKSPHFKEGMTIKNINNFKDYRNSFKRLREFFLEISKVATKNWRCWTYT